MFHDYMLLKQRAFVKQRLAAHREPRKDDATKKLCFTYHAAFSVTFEEGGYFHEDGDYVEEKTLVLTLIDAEKDIIQKIAKDLCSMFHQESILVTEDNVRGYYIM